jgi:hypothetical protein
MKVVILGAGASYDSIHTFHSNDQAKEAMRWRPPLARELFDTRDEFLEILKHYDGAQAFASEIIAGANLEQKMQEVKYTIDKTNDPRLKAQFINTTFYLHHLLFRVSLFYPTAGSCNYEVLMRWAYSYCLNTGEDVCFITFNYDILLERAFEKIILRPQTISSIDDYIAHRVKIIKPHGSCNWVKKLTDISAHDGHEEPTIAKMLYRNLDSHLNKKKQLEQSPKIRINNGPNMLRDTYDESSKAYSHYFPQISIPLIDKTDFLIPSSHRKVLEGSLTKAKDLLLIGWRGAEIKFQELLKKHVGQRPVKVTLIDPGFKDLKDHFVTLLPQAEFTEPDEGWHYSATTFEQSGDMIMPGHFSSFIKNVTFKKRDNFFSYL